MRTKPSSSPYHGKQSQLHTAPLKKGSLALCIALALVVGTPSVLAAQVGPVQVQNQRAAAFWQDVTVPAASTTARTSSAKTPALQLRRVRAASLDLAGIRGVAREAPMARSGDLSDSSLIISLPHPDGGYQRFTLEESPVMEPGLAAKHPDIKTYRGKGVDDPRATLRMDITQLGLHASVRSPDGGWYVDPYYRNDTSVYASYTRADLINPRAPLVEGAIEPQLSLSRSFYQEGDSVVVNGAGFAPGASVSLNIAADGDGVALHNATVTADKNGAISVTLPAAAARQGAFDITATDGRNSTSAPYRVVDASMAANAVVGSALRTYRLALVTDPSYATYFGPANVTAAKVTLINRVTQVYEDETSISLVLIDATDALNLNTSAEMTSTNGPCGGAACFTPAQAAGCTSATLSRNRIVTGLLAGASNFDVGHIAFGLNGGGIASLGVVGGNGKAQGCTGIPTPTGDFFAVDYVAHELGHQFSGNHTFNGTIGSCSGGNRSAATSVEPGSGSSIMAYAGICGTDNLQPHSDPYWSQRSFDEIVAYTSGADTTINEVQAGALTGFTDNGQQFQLSFNGNLSTPIVRGTSYTTAGVKAAIESIVGWPSGGTVTVSQLTETGFTVTFGGTLSGTNVPSLVLTNVRGGGNGFIGEIARGGLTNRGGSVAGTSNSAPSVTVAPTFTIPVRTPFALTGSAVDDDDDTVTYMWEQNDRGGSTGTSLINNVKLNGPLFRQFGTRAIVTSAGTLEYSSPGQNQVTTNPTRVFPDMAQILVNNTNAVTGACPTASTTPTATEIDCFSEFLPTAAYVGVAGTNAAPASLNFKLTARDGRGGVNSATTTLVLAPAAGPFLVTSPNTATTINAGPQTVTWSVANTNAAPVSTANVKITLSTDGGVTWPYLLAASVPNTGSANVTFPAVATTQGRIRIEAVGNVFFDVSDANFTLANAPVVGDVTGDGVVDCADVAVVRASLNKRTGQAGFDPRADVNSDGVVNTRDLSFVLQRVPTGTVCS
jgi:hypothetical protein